MPSPSKNIRMATMAFLPLKGVQEWAHSPLEVRSILFPSRLAVTSLPVVRRYSSASSATRPASVSSEASSSATARSGTMLRISPPCSPATLIFEVDFSVNP